MKHQHLVLSVVAVAIAAACSACGEKPAPPPEIKVDTASEALRKDQKDISDRFAEQKAATDANFQQERARGERQQSVDTVLPVLQKLDAAVQASRTTGRSDFGPLIKKVEPLKAEAAALTTDDCTDKVRSDLIDAIAATLDAFNGFVKEKGPVSEASTQKFTQVASQVDALGQALSACRNL